MDEHYMINEFDKYALLVCKFLVCFSQIKILRYNF